MLHRAWYRVVGLSTVAGILAISGCVEPSEPLSADGVGYATTMDAVAELDHAVARGMAYPSDGSAAGSVTALGLPIVIFKDFDAWLGEARVEATLQAAPFHLVRNQDYEVLPTSTLAGGIPATTQIAIITSNSINQLQTALNVRGLAARASMDAFVQAGGTLLMHLADNQPEPLRFIAPGMTQARDGNGASNTLTVTATSSAFAAGPNGVLNTSDDATTSAVQLIGGAWAHHGDLDNGLPGHATTLMTGAGGGVVYAEYSHGAGRVVVGTLTFEYGAEFAGGVGYGHPNRTLINHLWHVLYSTVDSDDDGVTDDRDMCPGTEIPDDVPTVSLGVNRFALLDGSGVFTTGSARGRGIGDELTIHDTAGCSCSQIIENLGLGRGHVKFGCSAGAMWQWVALVNE